MQTVLLGCPLLSAVVYIAVGFTGGLVPVKSLITFELMVGISTPAFLIIVVEDSWRHYTVCAPMDLGLLGAWVCLLFALTAYWLYDQLDINPRLGAKGRGTGEVGPILWTTDRPK